MIPKQELEKAIKHVQKLHSEFCANYPHKKMFGTTQEEIADAEKIHAMLWLGVLDQKPHAFDEADNFIRNALLFGSVMIELNIMNARGEMIQH